MLDLTNMKNVRILDCTLRDGGRIIDCAFSDHEIKEITERLTRAQVDIVEIGFLRDQRNVTYKGDSTFFTDVEQMRPFIDRENENVMYVAFIDYGMFDIESLKPYDGTSIEGIRLGFTKKDYLNEKENIIFWMNSIKQKGYKLFVQGVNTLNYNDRELLEIVDMVNTVHPYSFGIVDTYGAMYMDDVDRLYNLVDHNMLQDICINFHSHNNYQLSFAFAQEIIKLSGNSTRKVIIDGTLCGIGKVAGNLNTELVLDFLVRKMHYDYDMDIVFDTIDDYIEKYSKQYSWGYSVASLMAGVYKSHPNNVIYLTEKFRLCSKDIGKLLALIDPNLRQRYDYAYIENVYQDYSNKKVNDYEQVAWLKEKVKGKDVLVLVPGYTLNTHAKQIDTFIKKKNPIVFSVNFVDENRTDFVFYGNQKRYMLNKSKNINRNVILTSNVDSNNEKDIIFNYHSLVNHGCKMFDNSTLMLLNLLKKVEVKSIALAGFDGFSSNENNNFVDDSFQNERHNSKHFNMINQEIGKMLEEYMKVASGKCSMFFLTPSYYRDYLLDTEIVFCDGEEND